MFTGYIIIGIAEETHKLGELLHKSTHSIRIIHVPVDALLSLANCIEVGAEGSADQDGHQKIINALNEVVKEGEKLL